MDFEFCLYNIFSLIYDVIMENLITAHKMSKIIIHSILTLNP